MRKSSFGGRTSFSSAPLRVRNDNMANGGRLSSVSDGRSSFGVSGGSKLPVLNPRKSVASAATGQFPSVPKSGRPSSGIGVRQRTDGPTKDPRPISDKRFQTKCIQQLLDFLVDNGYPHPISHKLLVSPSSKDFFRIFEFIYGKYAKGYKMGPKMEDEVPRILRMIGYPFALSKTYLFSAGSPHTWPHLLAALTWMIELFQMTENVLKCGGIDVFMFESKGDDFEGVSVEKIVFDYCEMTYMAFMRGADTFEKYDQILEQAFMQKYQGGNIEDIIAENARLEAEVKLLEQGDERRKQLKEGISMSQHDAKVIQTYIENLQQYKKVQEGELLKREEDIEVLKSDLETERAKLVDMQKIYEKQDLTPADVERLRAEQEGLKQQVELLEKQIASIDADTWSITMEQAKLNEKVEMEVATYNRQAIALKLVPETAELANGRDFRLRSGFNSDIVNDFENNVKPMLMLMKKRCTNELRRKNKEKFQLALETEQFQETVNEQKERVAQMRKELANREAEIESMKQMFHSGKKTEEIEALQEEVVRLDTLLKQTEAEAARATDEHRRVSTELGTKMEDVKKQLSELEENRVKVERLVADSLTDLQNQLLSCVDQIDAAGSDMSRRISEFQLKSKQRKERLQAMIKK